MTPVRIAVALLLCSLAFAQERPSPAAAIPGNANDAGMTAIATAEPWRLLPTTSVTAVAKSPLEGLQIDQFRIDPSGRALKLEAKADPVVLGSESLPIDGLLPDDTTCYAIRSYVVARDRKNSDSTHPVSYSTCQPASRYRLKTAEAKIKSSDH